MSTADTFLRSADAVGRALMDSLSDEVVQRLRTNDIVATVEEHFGPVRVQALPELNIGDNDCSVDGYYETHISEHPTILYARHDNAPRRNRFTILHELAHHLLAGPCCNLLDDLDQIGDRHGGASQAEELACHSFAGRILIADSDLEDLIGTSMLKPEHIVELHRTTNASFDAAATRAANFVSDPVAVVVLREASKIAFCASTGLTPWPKGSPVKPRGPLDRAFVKDAHSKPEEYRYERGYAEARHCSTARAAGVHTAIGVLNRHNLASGPTILDQPDQKWKVANLLCEWCSGERERDWCERCAGKTCNDCGRCQCSVPTANRVCSGCFQHKPFNPGASYCKDCEQEGMV